MAILDQDFVSISGVTVLSKEFVVVDDDDLVRETISETLELLFEAKVHQVTNGLEALELIKSLEQKSIVLITDINMPKMDGFELVNQVKALNYEFPIIMISGYNENKSIHNKDYPYAKFFSKPVDIQELRAHIEKLV